MGATRTTFAASDRTRASDAAATAASVPVAASVRTIASDTLSAMNWLASPLNDAAEKAKKPNTPYKTVQVLPEGTVTVTPELTVIGPAVMAL